MEKLLVLLLLPLAGCAAFGAGVDDACIAGRLTVEGARLLNETEGSVNWHSDYVARLGMASERDRILGAHCSEAIKAVSGALTKAIQGDGGEPETRP